MGPRSPATGMILIVTPPGPGDRRTRTAFDLRDPSHLEHLEILHRTLGYNLLGEWHTHPEQVPAPSRDDLASWQSTADRNPDHPWFLGIVQGFEELRAVLVRPGDRRWYPPD